MPRVITPNTEDTDAVTMRRPRVMISLPTAPATWFTCTSEMNSG